MNDGNTNIGEDDRILVERYLRDRDEDSFRTIYRRHTPALYRIALAMRWSVEEAEDVIQEVWLRAARALPQFRWSSALRTWLVGIAINCCRELIRDRSSSASYEPIEPSREERSEKMDLLRAIRDLPPRSREVLLLHEILGHSHDEIASVLEIDQGTSKSQLSYARKRLRQWFDERSARRGAQHAER